MKFEKEITVELSSSFDEVEILLKQNDFKLRKTYSINDIYMVDKKFLNEKNNLELLKHCAIIRQIVEDTGTRNIITYKYKEYNDKQEIVKQGMVDCKIYDVDEAKVLLEALGYEELIRINDTLSVFENGEDEFALQEVNGKHLYMEIEDKCNFINKFYNGIDELKAVISKYNFPLKSQNYFVKKAEIEILEKYGDR